jgi:hypothetical protein
MFHRGSHGDSSEGDSEPDPRWEPSLRARSSALARSRANSAWLGVGQHNPPVDDDPSAAHAGDCATLTRTGNGWANLRADTPSRLIRHANTRPESGRPGRPRLGFGIGCRSDPITESASTTYPMTWAGLLRRPRPHEKASGTPGRWPSGRFGSVSGAGRERRGRASRRQVGGWPSPRRRERLA